MIGSSGSRDAFSLPEPLVAYEGRRFAMRRMTRPSWPPPRSCPAAKRVCISTMASDVATARVPPMKLGNSASSCQEASTGSVCRRGKVSTASTSASRSRDGSR
ncbi:hypothetical protein HPB47_008675 [Ixodes persulcatus]|uniref:Uncharacterized protein n=1 Tax=Ixodes persulcatus TaxID=34615 RepID=A0AC60P438_IXOPE|nr:hypothetical protein HPB47_008675 [Ixodes persulcatus]